MKKCITLFLLGGILSSGAIIVTGFEDMETFLKRGKDIVIADCISFPTNRVPAVNIDNLHPVKVNILRSLKGGRMSEEQMIATIYTMTPGKRYFLYSMGGSAYGADFLAIPQLSVVEIPGGFDLKKLDNKPLKEQVSLLFASRLAQLKLSAGKGDEEKGLLEKALHN